MSEEKECKICHQIKKSHIFIDNHISLKNNEKVSVCLECQVNIEDFYNNNLKGDLLEIALLTWLHEFHYPKSEITKEEDLKIHEYNYNDFLLLVLPGMIKCNLCSSYFISFFQGEEICIKCPSVAD